ncbi:MAG: hypothetical protein ETSY1_19115 [Candidatus Entotheonella factor]|uniref:Uncharacterized protein n=1 Tax=Entotheonella factor TaxID=1429438 RepID=W4LJS7_ENTF1|nr:hypothetical protein [Candidatus Entotheonella palauensis]ETW98333.1 MAG: hypothetical protein ETSY1_19115 [Candidatus Entotheonella factor]
MTSQQLILRFPEIKDDLYDEPLLAQYAETFGDLLQQAENPGACSADYSPGNLYYLKLMGQIRLHMYGLVSKEKVLDHMQDLLDRHAADPEGFVESLLTADSTL